MRHFWRLTWITLAALALLLAGCSLASEPIPAGPIETGPLPGEVTAADVPASLPLAGQGALIYEANCASCHGADGSGGGEFAEQIAQQGGQLPDLSDPALARSRSPLDWYRIITNGNLERLMPPWGDALSDDQRWSTAYFLYSLSAPAEVIAEGRELYEANFAAEYGANGEAIGLDDPAALAALSPQAIFDQYTAGRGDLSDDQRWAVVAYMQTFGYDASLETASLTPPEVAAEETPAPEAAEQPEAETAPEAGVVQGSIVAGTPGGSVPAGLEVRLRGLTVNDQNQVTEFLAQTATAGADGSFRFEGLPFDVQRAAYVVETTYNGVVFSNGQVIDAANPAMTLPLTVYETTTDASVITVDAMHLVLREHPDALLVMQLYVFSNASDRLFVTEQPVSGGRRGSVAIAIPPDAYDVQFEDGQLGGRFVALGDRIYDTDQMLPGSQSHSIIVTYFLPFDGPRDVELPLLYNTAQVTVLAQEGQRIRAEQLTDAGAEVIDNTAYSKLIGSGLAAGETLSLRISRGAAAGNVLPIVLASAAGVLLAGGVVYWVIQRRRLLPAPALAGIPAQQEGLLREIAQLDEAFAAGRINRFEYEARRADLKASLAEQMEG